VGATAWSNTGNAPQYWFETAALGRFSTGLGVGDRDVSFWVGTVSPTVSLSGSTFGTLAALGFGPQVNWAPCIRRAAGPQHVRPV